MPHSVPNKYFVKNIADINTPALARKFRWSPQDGGRFDITATKVLLTSDDFSVLKDIPLRDQMDAEQVKDLMKTAAWAGERTGFRPNFDGHLMLVAQDRSYSQLKKDYNVVGLDLEKDLESRVGARTGQDLEDYLVARGFTVDHVRDFEGSR